MDLFKPNVAHMREKKDVRGLLKALSYKDPQVRAAACEALIYAKDKSAVEPLIAALKDQDAKVRNAAAAALGWLGDPRAASALLAALPDRATFGEVALALANLKDPRLFDLLLPALRDDTSSREAAVALGQLGDPRAVEPLIELLHQENEGARPAAVVALGRLGGARAAEALWEALQHENRDVRWSAIRWWSKLPEALDREKLLGLLRHPDADVRDIAAGLLGKFGLPEDPAEQAWYAAALGKWEMAARLGSVATEPLLLATRTENLEKRLAAAKALARVGDRRAAEVLASCLSEKKLAIFEETLTALGEYGDMRTAKLLRILAVAGPLEVPICRPAAGRALAVLESRLKRIALHPPVCFSCGQSIPMLESTIADDIRGAGGVASGAGLEQKVYQGVICRTCGRVSCQKCHDAGAKGHSCPVCQHELSPLFADYMLGKE